MFPPLKWGAGPMAELLWQKGSLYIYVASFKIWYIELKLSVAMWMELSSRRACAAVVGIRQTWMAANSALFMVLQQLLHVGSFRYAQSICTVVPPLSEVLGMCTAAPMGAPDDPSLVSNALPSV